MPFQVNRRVPWAIAIAALALWATAPGGWARAALQSASPSELSAQTDQTTVSERTTSSYEITSAAMNARGGNADPGAAGADGCDTPDQVPIPSAPLEPSGMAAPLPSATAAAAPSGDQTAPGAPGAQVTFRLCGGTTAQAERAVEQFIAGRAFSATLTGQPGGCADLVISVGGALPGRQNTSMTVGLAGAGAQGAGRNVRVQIASENGATRASISIDG